MSKKVTLLWCLHVADIFTLDGYETMDITFHNGNGPEGQVCITRADEEEFDFLTRQEAELTDGQAFFTDIDGDEHTFDFKVSRSLEAP